MNRQTDKKSSAHSRRAKVSIKYSPRPLLAAATLIAFFLLMVFLTSVLSPRSLVRATTESINTSAANCEDPQPNNTWNLGGTVCATATGTAQPSNGFRQRRFQWVAPDGSVAKQTDVTSDPQNDTYTVPTSGAFRQPGTWRVQTIDNDGDIRAQTRFVVRDPNNASADLSVTKYGPIKAVAGSNISYTVIVTNQGPDDAQTVVLNDAVPANTTFVSENQVSGPSFTCVNTGGTTACTIVTLPANATATFTLTYFIAAGTPLDTVITNTASISSATNELNDSDNTSSFGTTVTGESTTCTINCPSNITQDNDANQCSAVVTYSTPSTSGNCGSPPDNAVTCSPASGSVFPMGSTVVTCSTQSGGACSFTVTVHDTRPPVQPTITCPGNITTGEDTPDSGEATVNYPPPTTTGNCVTTACDPPSGSRFVVGTTTVNCTATDSANNMKSCAFTVTVTSGAACTLTCPADVTQNAPVGQCSATVTYTSPTTSGNCGTVTCEPPSGAVFAVGTTVVTCTSDQGPTCNFNVTVVAPGPPTITTCATDKTVTADSNCEAPIPNLVPEVQTTGCNVTVTQSPAAGAIVGPGATTVTLTAENSAGEAHCTATVTILTPAPPTISCPGDSTRSNDAGQCGAVVSYPAPTGTSPCPGLTLSCSPASGSNFPIGATTVTCTARDASGQTATCTFKVTVNDTQPPTISCPASVTKNNDHNECGAVVNYASPTAADNCPGVTTSCTPASGTQFAVGTTTVTCTARDASNNTATCTFTVTVNDTQPPTITCPSNIQVGTDPGSATAIVNYNPNVSDNCPGAVTVVCTPASGSQFHLGTVTVTCTATDAANNQSSCSFSVTVLDTQPPTISCPPNQTRSNDSNQCSALVDYPPPSVTDNEPGATAACSPPSHSFFPVGTTAVTCTATDVGGNQSSCSFTVTVNDTQSPTIVCPPNMTASNTAGQCSANVNPGTAVATDNCPGVTVVGSRSDGLALNAPYPVGTTTITWTARDASGNQSSCTQTIVVNDTQAPTITGAAANPSTLWPPNNRMVDVAINYSVTDNCTPSSQITCTLSVTSNEGTSADWVIVDAHHVRLRADRNGGGNGRVYTITITCRDSSNNTTTTTVTVTVPHNQ